MLFAFQVIVLQEQEWVNNYVYKLNKVAYKSSHYMQETVS